MKKLAAIILLCVFTGTANPYIGILSGSVAPVGSCALTISQTSDTDYHICPLQSPCSQKIQNSGLSGLKICQIDLKLAYSAANAACHVQLNTAKDGTGTVLGNSQSATVTSALTTPGWLTFTFSTPVNNPGADFYILLISEDANNCYWRLVDPDNYAGTTYFTYANGGDHTTEDFAFRIYTQ